MMIDHVDHTVAIAAPSAAKEQAPCALAPVLRLEGLALFAVSALLYARTGAGWPQFAWLFLVPDLSFAAYWLGPRAGALAYNTLHSELGPALLAAAALSGLLPSAALALALIWAAHVGLDRALGYGLKYADRFDHTHLGAIGKARQAARPRRHEA